MLRPAGGFAVRLNKPQAAVNVLGDLALLTEQMKMLRLAFFVLL
jgi:hypothetical protein